MIKFFRIISGLEGLSYLVILSVTIGLISRDYVYLLGMGHGVLFAVYLVTSLLVTGQQKWSIVIWVLLLLAALVPFAFIPVEVFLRKAQHAPVTVVPER